GERFAQHALDAEPVDIAHREDHGIELAQELPLAFVERANADQSHTPLRQSGQAPTVLPETLTGETQRGGEDHPVNVPGRTRLGAVEIAVCVDPDHAPRTVDLPQARQGSERNAVVSTENDRAELVASGTRHESGHPLRCVPDLPPEPGLRV